jgi:hypothetical protein
MHVKVDEDLPHIAATWLREQGYEASTISETDKTDFYGFFICADPCYPLNPWLIFSGE